MYSSRDSITGRWSGKKYTVLKKLGCGGVGEIYLVKAEDGRLLALKISKDIISITKEYNYLKRFESKGFLPKAYELDDCEEEDRAYHFFTMEYIEGCTLKSAILNKQLPLSSKFRIICLITKIIKQINDEGFVYTDLKYENIMLDKKNGLIKLIDLGSLVELGQNVKEYTPMYDRLSWEAGSRRADASYQVFAIILLFISMILDRRLDPEKEKLDKVMQTLKRQRLPDKVYEVIAMSIAGNINDCEALYCEIAAITEGSFKLPWLTKLLDIIIVILVVLLSILGAAVLTK